MAIQVQCHECGKTLSVKDELAGKRVKCPCGAVVTATAGAAVAGAGRPTRSAPTRLASPPSSAGRAAPARSAPGVPTSGQPYIGGSDDLSSLFDELTESDLQTKRERDRDAAESQAAAKDPLAAFRTGKGDRAARSGGSGPRPVGLTILAVLNFLIAALMITFGVLSLVGPETLGDAVAKVQFLQGVVTHRAVQFLVTGVFFAATGAGLLSGQTWGWWLGITFYAYNTCEQVFAAVFALVAGAPPITALINLGMAVVAGGALAYLYNNNVRGYHRIKTKVAVAAVITIGSMALLAFLLHLGLHLMIEDVPAE